MSEWRKIWTNGLPNEGRSQKSCHRMAAEGIRFPWRWNGGTICLKSGVIWEMSAQPCPRCPNAGAVKHLPEACPWPRRCHLGRAGPADHAEGLRRGWRGGGAAVAQVGRDAGAGAADVRRERDQGRPGGPVGPSQAADLGHEGQGWPESPRHALLAENPNLEAWGKASLWVITKDLWYQAPVGLSRLYRSIRGLTTLRRRTQFIEPSVSSRRDPGGIEFQRAS